MRARGDHFRVISGFGPSPLPPSSPLPLLPRRGQLSFLPCVPASRRDGRVALRRRPPRSSGAHAAQSPRLGSGPGRRRCPAVVGERLPAGNDHGRNCHLCEKVLKERGRARRPEILPLRGCHQRSSHSSAVTPCRVGRTPPAAAAEVGVPGDAGPPPRPPPPCPRFPLRSR